jgi:cytidine deaminase
MDSSKQINEGNHLIDAASAQLGKAYAPYSNFPVACALIAEDGTIVTGVNVENGSYGLTICAERCAVFAGVAAGHRRFKAAAVVAKLPGVTPCGACRQVLSEFMDPSAPLYYPSDSGLQRTTIGDLLPNAFGGPTDATLSGSTRAS